MAAKKLEFRLLGPFAVVADGRDLTPARPKRRVLLALLALNANEVVSSEELVEALWGESPPETALSALHGHVSALRKLLGQELIETRPPGYLLRLADERIDICRFQTLVDKTVREREPARRAELFREGLLLFRGEPLSDFRYEAFAREHVLRLEELRLAATEERIDAELEFGRHAELVPELQRLVASDPLRERLRSQLMLALYRSGRQSDALHAYQVGRQILAQELGIDPGPALQRLQRQILNQDPALAKPPSRAAGPGHAAPTNLPRRTAPLIGRERQLAELRARLLGEGTRLWTLIGPAGTGKTRLAVEVAASLVDHFPDGTFFVALAPIADPELVLPTVADTLGVDKGAGVSLAEILEQSLADRKLLLVLDNFEHLLAAAPAVSGLVAATHEVAVLATSREPLHVGGERAYPVPPLELPAEDDLDIVSGSESVQLFVERAQALRPEFELSEPNSAAVAQICRRLDGLPLAIELAAARIPLFPPAALLRRLDERLKLLTGGGRDRPERHQTLRAAIDWSHELMSEQRQTLFARLSVFAGGWTVEAAEAVCDGDIDVLDGLASLIDKSLIRLEGTDEEPRFAMLETIREYARERLEAVCESDTRQRHAGYYLTFAEERHKSLTGSAAPETHAQLSAELDNFRAALTWAVESGEGALAFRLVSALRRFWWDRGLAAESHDWYESAVVAAPDAPPDVRGRALLAAADASVARGDWEENRRQCEEAVRLLEAGGDEETFLYAQHPLSVALQLAGEPDEAERVALGALARAEGTGYDDLMGRLNIVVGAQALERGDAAAARSRFEAAAAKFQEMGHSYGRAAALENLATAALAAKDPDSAANALAECLDAWDLSQNVHDLGHCLVVAARIAQARGEAAVAAQFLGTVAAIVERLGVAIEHVEAEIERETRSLAEAELGAARYEEELERGAASDPADELVRVKEALKRWANPATPPAASGPSEHRALLE